MHDALPLLPVGQAQLVLLRQSGRGTMASLSHSICFDATAAMMSLMSKFGKPSQLQSMSQNACQKLLCLAAGSKAKHAKVAPSGVHEKMKTLECRGA